MAYSKDRFTENAQGKTGWAGMALYDGSGTDAQGGDTLATIRGPNFFTGQEVKDACRVAAKGDRRNPTTGIIDPIAGTAAAGGGLLCIIRGRNALGIDILYLDPADDQVKTIGSNHRIET